jgi:hypothetical protein
MVTPADDNLCSPLDAKTNVMVIFRTDRRPDSFKHRRVLVSAGKEVDHDDAVISPTLGQAYASPDRWIVAILVGSARVKQNKG